MKTKLFSLVLILGLISCQKDETSMNPQTSTSNRVAGKSKLNKTQQSGGNYYYTYAEVSSAMSTLGASSISTPPGFVAEFQDHSNVYFYQLGSTIYHVYQWSDVEDIPSESESGCTRIWYSDTGACDNEGNDCKPKMVTPTTVVIICC